MKVQVHRLNVDKDTVQEKLEQFLNQRKGKILSIVPFVRPSFQFMGATSKTAFLLIVEEIS